jgi:hypothetical protein
LTDETIRQLEKGIGSITEGSLSSSYFNSIFKDMATANLQNAQILSKFLKANIEQNLAQQTSSSQIRILYYFNRYLGYKPFEKVVKDDILSYLLSLRKSETDDPTHRWIGTYNIRQMILS